MSEWAPDPEPRGPISAQRNTDRGASLDPMEMGCAECGCVVDRGVIVRDVGIPNTLRVTAGTPAETDAFLEALAASR